MKDDEKGSDFSDRLANIMGANEDMINDMLVDLGAVLPTDAAAEMERALKAAYAEYEAEMSALIAQTRDVNWPGNRLRGVGAVSANDDDPNGEVP